MLEVAFDQVVDGRLSHTLELTATKNSRTFNWLDEPCKSKDDSYWIDDRKRSFNDQLCVRVGFKSNVVDGARGEAFQIWARDLVSKGVGYSREMPFVRVTRFTPYDFLQMTVAFDPEGYGIARSRQADRMLNDWQPQLLATHPEREAFYQSLKTWSATFTAAVVRAFDGDSALTSTDFGAPSLRKQ